MDNELDELNMLDAQLDRLFDPRPIGADEAVQLHFDFPGDESTRRPRPAGNVAKYMAKWRAAHPEAVQAQRERYCQKRRLSALAELIAEWRSNREDVA